ncbi:MAG: 30S ribosomal protein S16 [Acidobacteriota bacterium]
MVSIRLMRFGAKKKPFYRIVAIDSRRPRESKALEYLGYYNPLTNPAKVEMNYDRVKYWIERGAQPSDTVRSIIARTKKDDKTHSK